jgi:hypothetical protein
MLSLSRLVRGLSALFWGLPIALVVCVQTGKTSLLGGTGILPPLIATALPVYGLILMFRFQRQERVWRNALDRTLFLGFANVGLSPFLYWWRLVPEESHYRLAVGVLALSGLLFLFNLNQTLLRLAAMLPDETLRMEARMFTTLNRVLVLFILTVAALWFLALNWRPTPAWLMPVLSLMARPGLVLLLLTVLLPVAMSMALIWKIKETVLLSVFSQENRS